MDSTTPTSSSTSRAAAQVLNLGCGHDYLDGAINVDQFAAHVDVRHDLDKLPYPFADDTFSYIRCMNIIEHLDDVMAVMGELHRVGCDGCRITLRVPHFRSACLYEDLTHRHGFAWRSFDVLATNGTVYGEYTSRRFKIASRAYTPYKIPLLYNLLSRMPVLTDNLLSKFIPMASILFELVVVKQPPQATPPTA